VAKGRRQEASHVLHKKHTWPDNFYESKKLPKKCPARILNGPSPASRAERLAGWTTHKQIKFSWLDTAFIEDFMRVESGNIALENSEIFGESPGGTIQSNRLAKRVFLLDTSSDAESSCLLKAEV
jgi:hypothetical protein